MSVLSASLPFLLAVCMLAALCVIATAYDRERFLGDYMTSSVKIGAAEVRWNVLWITTTLPNLFLQRFLASCSGFVHRGSLGVLNMGGSFTVEEVCLGI